MTLKRKIFTLIIVVFIAALCVFTYSAFQKKVLKKMAETAITYAGKQALVKYAEIETNVQGRSIRLTEVTISDFNDAILRYITKNSLTADEIILKNIDHNAEGLKSVDLMAVNLRPTFDDPRRRPFYGVDVNLKVRLPKPDSIQVKDINITRHLDKDLLFKADELAVTNLPADGNFSFVRNYSFNSLIAPQYSDQAKSLTFTFKQTTAKETSKVESLILTDNLGGAKEVEMQALTLAVPQDVMAGQMSDTMHPFSIDATLNSLRASTGAVYFLNALKQMGYDNIDLSGSASLFFDTTADKMLTKITLSDAAMANTDLSFGISDIDAVDLLQGNAIKLPTYSLNAAEIAITNHGLFEKYTSSQAAQQNMTKEDWIKTTTENIAAFTSEFSEPYRSNIPQTVSSFLSKPEIMKASIRPETPMGIGAFVITYFTNYKHFPETLNFMLKNETIPTASDSPPQP